MDISTVKDGFEIAMEDYVDSLDKIKEIRKADRDDDLTKMEIKEYRKVTVLSFPGLLIALTQI